MKRRKLILGKPSPPKPPDPNQVAGAQTGSNIGTSVANAWLNNYNQITPWGSLSYDQTGSKKWTDPLTGKVYNIPTMTATQTLSPQQQKLMGLSTGAQINLAGLAKDQSSRLSDLLSRPLNLDNSAVESRLMDLGRARLDPVLADRRSSLETQLSNKGIKLGSTAYDRALGDFGKQENDAYTNLLLAGRQQSVSELMAERNQPLNEIIGLLSGSQVHGAGYVNPNTSPIANTDYAGIVSNNYNQQMNAWNAQNQQRQGLLGGLFSLGSSFISDRRAKTDIKKVGKTDDGQKIYAYRYRAGGPMQLGLMAQEVLKKNPAAVAQHPSGFMMVDYGRALGA
jgi:hypothetical protein